MATVSGLNAPHAFDNWGGGSGNYGGVLWSAQRAMSAGAVKIQPTDYTITYCDSNGVWHADNFQWLSVEFALYARKIGNSVLSTPLRIGSPVVIRKYWGTPLGYTTIAMPSSSGLYSLYTRPVQVSSGGYTSTLNGSAYGGMSWSLNTTFNLQYT